MRRWLLLVAAACGRLGFDPVAQSAPDDASGDSSGFCRYSSTCAPTRELTCCESSGNRCVPTRQTCQGQTVTCDVEPPYDGCGIGEVCCILPPDVEPTCYPDNGQC